MGGIGEERDISIQSGSCVAEALKEAGLNVVTADIRPDKMDILDDPEIDVFFIALHGKFGEDGQLQQILEDKSLVYTGSGPAASKLAFDKMASKKVFAKAGIITPAAIEFPAPASPDASRGGGDADTKLQQLAPVSSDEGRNGGAPQYVIKPIRQGSSVGVSIVRGADEAVTAARKCLGQFGDCMIEEFIPGREVTVGILGNQALPIIEIKSKTGFYDYQAKYVDERTEFLFDTIEPAQAEKIKVSALNCFNVLSCQGFARVDFILGDDEKAYVLEVNTIPGFTSHSLLPKAAAKAGIPMGRLCVKVIDAALKNKIAYRG